MAKIDPDESCPCESGLKFRSCHGPKVESFKMPEITSSIALKVIPKPPHNTASVFERTGEGTLVFSGSTVGLSMNCGECGSQLVVGIPRENINKIVLKCNKCGKYNAT